MLWVVLVINGKTQRSRVPTHDDVIPLGVNPIGFRLACIILDANFDTVNAARHRAFAHNLAPSRRQLGSRIHRAHREEYGNDPPLVVEEQIAEWLLADRVPGVPAPKRDPGRIKRHMRRAGLRHHQPEIRAAVVNQPHPGDLPPIPVVVRFDGDRILAEAAVAIFPPSRLRDGNVRAPFRLRDLRVPRKRKRRRLLLAFFPSGQDPRQERLLLARQRRRRGDAGRRLPNRLLFRRGAVSRLNPQSRQHGDHGRRENQNPAQTARRLHARTPTRVSRPDRRLHHLNRSAAGPQCGVQMSIQRLSAFSSVIRRGAFVFDGTELVVSGNQEGVIQRPINRGETLSRFPSIAVSRPLASHF